MALAARLRHAPKSEDDPLPSTRHAQHVQQLFDAVSAQTKEVQLEAQRVLQTVEHGKGDNGRPAVGKAAELKRGPAAGVRRQPLSAR